MPSVFGADYSVYVRIVRLVLAEKGVDYTLEPVDVFAEGGPGDDYLQRHPFGRIPAFEHDGFQLYETGAIARYIDEAFAGPRLQPSDARMRARCNQLISIADNYTYPTLVWEIYVQRAETTPPDAQRIADALPAARTSLAAMSGLMGEGPWLCGADLSLADLYAAPIFAYFLRTPEGAAMMADFPALADWWARMAARPSMTATEPAS